MGIGDLAKNDQPEERSSDQPSVSYIYVYEQGRKELEEWAPEKQQVMARAYEAVSDGGIIRNTFKLSRDYINLHDAMGHFLAAMAEALENQNFNPVLEFVTSDDPETTAVILQDYLDEHPEVEEALAQVRSADPSDDNEPSDETETAEASD